MERQRKSYTLMIQMNGRRINEIIIDPHYKEKHSDISDELILELVKGMDGKYFEAEGRNGPWEFFSWDRIEYVGKLYRLVWCLKDDTLFIGVINCFRRD